MDETNAWIQRAAKALGVPADIATAELLALTRDVAHRVTRPAAPLTTYLVGLAVATGTPLEDARAAVEQCLDEVDGGAPATT